MTTSIMPEPRQRYYANNGTPAAGCLLYTYDAGTSTPRDVFTDPAGLVPHEWPLPLDAKGEALIYWSGTYKVNLTTAAGVQVTGYPVDNYSTDPGGILASIASLIGAAGAALVGFIQSGVGAVLSTVRSELQRSYYISQFETSEHAVIAAAGKRLFVGMGESVVLNVPSQFSTIQAAMTALAGWVIHGVAQIKLADGVYSPAGTIMLNHPYGQNIQIVGNAAAPDMCSIFGANPPSFDLFMVSSGNKFGLISGVRADLVAKAGLATNFTAFLALNGATLTLENCKSNNWYYGVAERNGATVVYTNGLVTNAGDVGVWAFSGGSIQCSGVQSNNATDVANGFGFGFQGEFGGVIDARNCSATGCLIAGFAALSNGTGRYYDCTANANTGSGFLSRGGGQIEANNSSSTNNSRYGLEITEYGNIVRLAVNSGNTLGPASKFPYFDTSTGTSRLASSSGQLRVDTNGTESIFFHTSGGLQSEVRHMPSAVNHVYMQGGGTGGPAIIGAGGEDEVIDLALLPHGEGGFVKIGAGYFMPAPVANGHFSVRLADGSLVQVPCFK